jgi:hypothetical protein
VQNYSDVGRLSGVPFTTSFGPFCRQTRAVLLSGTSFTSLKQLQDHIDAYVNAYNDRAEPFVWSKKKVRQRRFKGRRITQL